MYGYVRENEWDKEDTQSWQLYRSQQSWEKKGVTYIGCEVNGWKKQVGADGEANGR